MTTEPEYGNDVACSNCGDEWAKTYTDGLCEECCEANGRPIRMTVTIELVALDMDGTPTAAAELLTEHLRTALDQHEIVAIRWHDAETIAVQADDVIPRPWGYYTDEEWELFRNRNEITNQPKGDN